MEKAVTKPSVKRGRPAKISLDDIVNEAITQLAQDPGKPLSLNALARALGVTPMALYRYVDDRDALLQEIAGRLLHDLNPQIPEASWQEQLRTWAAAMRDYFLANPSLFSILGWQEHIASAWLSQLATLVSILERTGLQGKDLADTVQWVGSTVMSTIFMEISGQKTGYRLNEADLADMQPSEVERLQALISHLRQKSAGSVFSESIERILVNIEVSASHD
jgi:AcrR family transcriptional regulator